MQKRNTTDPDGRTSFVVDNEGDESSYKISCKSDKTQIESIKQAENTDAEPKKDSGSIEQNSSSTTKRDGQQSDKEQPKAEEKTSEPSHISYSDLSVSATRDNNDTIYVVANLTANCDRDSGYDDQAVIHYSVNDGKSQDMHPIPTEWEPSKANEGRSYSNEPLKCVTRFNANPGDVVSFWIEDPKSGATFEGLDELINQLDSSTTDAINSIDSEPESSGGSDDRVCYVIPNGYSYHSRKSCPRLSRSKELYELNVEEAKDSDYEPCDFCC